MQEGRKADVNHLKIFLGNHLVKIRIQGLLGQIVFGLALNVDGLCLGELLGIDITNGDQLNGRTFLGEDLIASLMGLGNAAEADHGYSDHFVFHIEIHPFRVMCIEIAYTTLL